VASGGGQRSVKLRIQPVPFSLILSAKAVRKEDCPVASFLIEATEWCALDPAPAGHRRFRRRFHGRFQLTLSSFG
jgi:hypothetical protein